MFHIFSAVTAGGHTLLVLATFIEGETPFPEFSAVLMLDDIQVAYYDSVIKTAVPRSPHLTESIDEGDQQNFRITAKFCHDHMQQRILSLRDYFNKTDVKPRVQLLRETLPDSEQVKVTCLATSFYSCHINLTLLRDSHEYQCIRRAESFPDDIPSVTTVIAVALTVCLTILCTVASFIWCACRGDGHVGGNHLMAWCRLWPLTPTSLSNLVVDDARKPLRSTFTGRMTEHLSHRPTHSPFSSSSSYYQPVATQTFSFYVHVYHAFQVPHLSQSFKYFFCFKYKFEF